MGLTTDAIDVSGFWLGEHRASRSVSQGRAVGIESPLGWMPRHHDLNWDGLETFTTSPLWRSPGHWEMNADPT